MKTLNSLFNFEFHTYNPSVEIVCAYFRNDQNKTIMISYYQSIEKAEKIEFGVEIYSGPNYIPNEMKNTGGSYSRNYKNIENLPPKYFKYVIQLKSEWEKHFKRKTI